MKKLFYTLDDRDKFIFLFETWIVISIVVIWILLVTNHILPTHVSKIHCSWYDYGYFCPGCGGTRAFESLLYGHLIKSFCYHPIVLYVLILIILSYSSYITYFATGGNIFFFRLGGQHISYIFLITMFWFLFRNYIAFYFNFNIYDLPIYNLL